MKLRFLFPLIFFNYLAAQDVEVPKDLLPPRTTTEKDLNNDISFEYDEDTTVKAEELPIQIFTTKKPETLIGTDYSGQPLNSEAFKENPVMVPGGMILDDGVPCAEGYARFRGQCYKILQDSTNPYIPMRPEVTTKYYPLVNYPEITTESIFSSRVCPNGFNFYNQQCYRCPASYNLCSGMCMRNVSPCQSQKPPPYPNYPVQYPNIPIPNINIHLNVPIPNIPTGSHSVANSKPVNIVNNIEPINNTIHNYNNITHPVTLNNVNQNNIYVYTETQCADGKIRSTIVKNNETIIGCDDPVDSKTEPSRKVPDSGEKETEDEDSQKCCEVVTPRRCKKRFTSQWMCTHRRYRRCGNMCIAKRLYVKPPATVWSNQILTIAPNPIQTYVKPCFGSDCPAVDCSGCIDGSYNCSPQCYTYPCVGGCTYIEQEKFCEKERDKEFCDE